MSNDPFVLLQPTPFAIPVAYGTGGTSGAKGDAGGNAMAVGLFTDFGAGVDIPDGFDLIRTSGNWSKGRGSAWYVHDTAVNSAYVTANPLISFLTPGVTSSQKGYRLVYEDQLLNPFMFGAHGGGTVNDGAVFLAAIAFLKSIALNSVISEFKASPRLWCPFEHFYLAGNTLDITHTLAIEGEGGLGIGSGGGAATKLRWDANTTGIRIQSEHTSGASTYDASGHYSGAFTTLRQLHLAGPAANSTGSLISLGLSEGEYHGLHVKGTVFLEHLTVEGFQGDGLYAHTTSGAGDATEGYSNCSRAYNCTFHVNRNGVSLFGGDANIWTFIGCQAISNRACGVDDQSFLGNTHIGWHTNGNGVYLDNTGASGFPAYIVSNGGNRYCPVQGQEATASTTAPSGTADTATWLYLGAGGTATGVPAWTTGMSLRCAAPYRTNNTNGRTVLTNCYDEGNQGFSQFVHPTIILGGLHGAGSPKGDGVYIRNDLGFFAVDSMNIPNTLTAAGGELGFFGHSINFQQNVLGSRGGNAALASLITCLVNLGLVTDGSSA